MIIMVNEIDNKDDVCIYCSRQFWYIIVRVYYTILYHIILYMFIIVGSKGSGDKYGWCTTRDLLLLYSYSDDVWCSIIVAGFRPRRSTIIFQPTCPHSSLAGSSVFQHVGQYFSLRGHITACGLRIPAWPIRITACRLRIPAWPVRIPACGLRISACGVRIPACGSAFQPAGQRHMKEIYK